MAIREHATEQKVILALNQTVVAAGTVYSSIIDTADYDAGVYFAIALLTFDGTNADHVFTIQEGAIANMSDAAAVPAAKLVYGDAIELDAVTDALDSYIKEACFSTKRYLRVKIVTTGTDVDTKLNVIAVVNPESQPTPQV